MDVYVQSSIGECDQFTSDETGNKKQKVSVVISPLRLEGDEQTKLRVVTGCNLWQACQTKACYFSTAARKLSTKNQ